MTPETATAATDPLAGWAFAVAIVALAITTFDSYINWRNRQDSKTVQFVLSGAMRRRPGVPTGVGAEPLRVWTLHNAGQASIVNPQIRVIG